METLIILLKLPLVLALGFGILGAFTAIIVYAFNPKLLAKHLKALYNRRWFQRLIKSRQDKANELIIGRLMKNGLSRKEALEKLASIHNLK